MDKIRVKKHDGNYIVEIDDTGADFPAIAIIVAGIVACMIWWVKWS